MIVSLYQENLYHLAGNLFQLILLYRFSGVRRMGNSDEWCEVKSVLPDLNFCNEDDAFLAKYLSVVLV